MRLNGINYDVGIEYGDEYVSRPRFDRALIRRELEIVAADLHCDAVRIAGTEPRRLIEAAREAVDLGLGVWISPHLHDRPPDETLDYARECAVLAEELRAGSGDRVVFILGTELTVFMKGVLPGDTLAERLADPRSLWKPALHGPYAGPLNEHLARANEAVREVFHGPVTYSSAEFEVVNWSLFDVACLNHYRAARNRSTYADQIKALFAWGKPVYLTEVGCCAYQGAEDRGGLGWSVVDAANPGHLKAPLVRDEELQAREVIDMLSIAEEAGAEGAFVFTFVTPALPSSDDPLRDLDLAGYAVVRTLPDGGHGSRYPDLPWTPKALFDALAERFGRDRLPVGRASGL